MGKQIVGMYHSEQETIHAINSLKRQGHQPMDIMVVTQDRSAVPMVAASTGARVEFSRPVTTLAGAMMESFFTVMTGGMISSHNGLTEKLSGMGIPDFTAKRCESEVNKGKILVLADTNPALTDLVYSDSEAQYETEEQRSIRLHEEQLNVTKERVQVGEVQLRKEIVEEQRTVFVPLTREEVYVERRPVIDGKSDGTLMEESEVIRVPIIEERIEVTKKPVVIEEVIIGKRLVQETKQVQDIIRKEEARIERSVLPDVQENKDFVNTTDLTDSKEEGFFISPSDFPISQEGKEILDMANELVNETKETVIELLNETKEADPIKKSTSSAIQENKNTTASENKKKK